MEDAPHPTERFERVIAFASDEADGLGHGYITCQHLLVALCRESQGLARAVFDRFGVMPEAVSSLLADTAAPHDRTVAQPLELAFETRQAMQRAIAAAVGWGDRTLDTEHLLYGLLSERSSADDLLGALNLKPDALLAVLTQLRQAAPPAAVREEAAHAYRFTVESGWLLALAAEFARGHAAVTSVHLLAALLELQTPAAAVFEDFGLASEHIRRALPPGGRAYREGRIPLAADIQRILGVAIGEAWNRGHIAVRPVHIALGLSRAGRHAALDLLADYGVAQADLDDALEAAAPPSVTH